MDTPTSSSFYGLLKDKFPHIPTTKQDITLQLLAEFLLSGNKDELFLLKGFAGTGKTTIVGDLVTNLWRTSLKSVLMAPTGRAA